MAWLIGLETVQAVAAGHELMMKTKAAAKCNFKLDL